MGGLRRGGAARPPCRSRIFFSLQDSIIFAARPHEPDRRTFGREAIPVDSRIRNSGIRGTLAAQVMYGCGFRLAEAMRLRVKDLDFGHPRHAAPRGRGSQPPLDMA